MILVVNAVAHVRGIGALFKWGIYEACSKTTSTLYHTEKNNPPHTS